MGKAAVLSCCFRLICSFSSLPGQSDQRRARMVLGRCALGHSGFLPQDWVLAATLRCPCCHPRGQVPKASAGAFPLGRGTDNGAQLEKWSRLSRAGTFLLLPRSLPPGQSVPTAAALTGVQALQGGPPAPHQAGPHILAPLAQGDGAGSEHGLCRPSRHPGTASKEAEKVVFLLQLFSINRGQPCLHRVMAGTTAAMPIVWGAKPVANPKKAVGRGHGSIPAGGPWSCIPGPWSLLWHSPFLLVGMSPRG